MEKLFALGDVLSVTTGKLVSPRHIEGIYDILNWMTGESLMTHQLIRASDICQPELFRQFPELTQVNVPESFEDEAAVWSWLHKQEELYGEILPVAKLPEGVYDAQDPIAELIAMRGSADGVLVLEI